MRCASLKSNLGHLEAAAAAAGLASLVAGPLLAGAVAVNAQLRRSTLACSKGEARETRCIARRLNAHLASIASSGSFRMPGEVLPRCGDATAAARLSSFGFSGTIAHALFASSTGARSSTASGVSLYRFQKAAPSMASARLLTPPILADAPDARSIFATGTLAVLSHHAVGGDILLPSVVELAFGGASRRAVSSEFALLLGHAAVWQSEKTTKIARWRQRGKAQSK